MEDISWSAPSSGLGCDGSSMKTETLGRDGSGIHFSTVLLSELSLLTVTTDVSMQNSISAIYRSILRQPDSCPIGVSADSRPAGAPWMRE